MKKSTTINNAIIQALESIGKPMRVKEIYTQIVEDDLYRFRAINPENIVRVQLRRHSVNLDFPTAHKSKHFIFLPDGTYWIKDKVFSGVKSIESSKESTKELSTYENLKSLHLEYVSDFKKSLLKQIQSLDPTEFEHFCRKLLVAYGFKKMKVTPKSRDGGIDGFGELKMGLVYLPVAFECKRWVNTTVGTSRINQFRGSIVGKYQQGIYFTTSRFTKDARDVSFQPGAPPIILIDGNSIIDLMIEKQFGIEIEEFPVFTNALDLILQND